MLFHHVPCENHIMCPIMFPYVPLPSLPLGQKQSNESKMVIETHGINKVKATVWKGLK